MKEENKKNIADLEDIVRQALDLDEWKHSWHLPKNKYGYTDWKSAETYLEVFTILNGKLKTSIRRVQFLTDLLDVKIDWNFPLGILERDIANLDYYLAEGNLSEGETTEDLIREREEIQNKIDLYTKKLKNLKLSLLKQFINTSEGKDE